MTVTREQLDRLRDDLDKDVQRLAADGRQFLRAEYQAKLLALSRVEQSIREWDEWATGPGEESDAR